MTQLDRYRKVSCQIWLDQKFLSLSDDGKLVFLLILTHPNLTSFGAMKASPASLTDELGWLTERLSEAFQEALTHGLIEYDQVRRLVVLPNFIKHNKPQSPNVIKSWVHGYKELPECEMKDKLFQSLKDYSEAMPEAFAKAFQDSFGKTIGIQGTGNSNNKNNKKPPAEKKPKKEKPPLALTRFAEFWIVYPKKASRPTAERAWLKHGCDDKADLVIAGAKRYASDVAGKEIQYVKNPGTWLNNLCWEDEQGDAPKSGMVKTQYGYIPSDLISGELL